MKKIVNMIIKSNQIRKRFFDKVNSQIKIEKDKHKNEGHNHHHDEDELDDHNDSSNWSYA